MEGGSGAKLFTPPPPPPPPPFNYTLMLYSGRSRIKKGRGFQDLSCVRALIEWKFYVIYKKQWEVYVGE